MSDTPHPKKGYASPLEGAVGKEIASVLNLAFTMVGVKMLQGLGMAATAKMGAGSPLLKTAGNKAGAAPAAAAKAAGPKAPTGSMFG